MIKYNFYCTICGTPFSASKKNARCCSNVCRFVLSKTMRYESVDADNVVLETKEEKEEAQEKLGDVVIRDKSKNENRGVDRNDIRAKRGVDFSEEDGGENKKGVSIVAKLLGKKAAPAVVEPAPADTEPPAVKNNGGKKK